MNRRRLWWTVTLLYAVASACYASAVLVEGLLLARVEEESPFVLVFLLGHVLVFPFAREGWDRYTDDRWPGLLGGSARTERILRTVIRLLAAALLLAGLTLVLAVRYFDLSLSTGDADRLAALGLAMAILFGAVVYGICSVVGGNAIVSSDPSGWESMLKKVGRGVSRRRRQPRDRRGSE